jgi:cytochrome c oxidase subunit II
MSSPLTGLATRIGVAACGLLALAAPAWADAGLGLADGEMRDFQLLVFALCAAIALAVLGAMLWSTVRHRKSNGDAPGGKAEVAWTIIPITIFVAMAAPAADTLIRKQDAHAGDFAVRVTGYQWKWEYDYLDHDVRYSSLRVPETVASTSAPSGATSGPGAEAPDANQPLVVPVGARVRVQLTSNDVNHGWWVRELGRRQNAIPGHINEFSFRARRPGTFRGECTEFCGPGDSCVPIVIKALPVEEFADWLRARTPRQPGPSPAGMHAGTVGPDPVRDLNSMIAHGRMLHVRNCAACHQESGLGLRAAGFPPLAGTRVSKDEHIRVAVHGRDGSGMAGFGPILGDAELAAIVTYQRNAWGNDTGDFVGPADIAAAR